MAKDFNPSDHSVDEVNARLEKASDDERQAILSAELAGKKRKGVLEPAGWDPDERRDASGRVLYPWELSPEDHEVPDVVEESEEDRQARAQRDMSATGGATTEQGGSTPAGSGTPAGGAVGGGGAAAGTDLGV